MGTRATISSACAPRALSLSCHVTKGETTQNSSRVIALLLILISIAVARRADASDTASASPRAESTSAAALSRNPGASRCRTNETGSRGSITVEGCLVGTNADFADEFSFSNYSGQQYDLIVRDPLLKKNSDPLVGRSVCVQGTLSEADEDTIEVTSIRALPKRVARLDPPIPAPSQWRERTNKTYGLSFRLPASFPSSENDLYVDSNFPVEGGAVTLGFFALTANLVVSPALPECDQGLNQFDGGRFVIFVNPRITNRGACEQFGESHPENHARHTFHGKKFSETSVSSTGMGKTYVYNYYQTFQNGLCYEFVFADFEGAPIDDDPCRCSYPEGPRTEKLEQTILSQLSFHKPQSPTAISSQPETAPEITSFTSSSATADQAKNRGSVKFSWSTSNADFVRFSYSCTSGEEIIKKGLPSLGLDGIVIGEEGATYKGCGGKLDTPDIVNHSANSSLNIVFGNSEFDGPIVVRVTLTPYSHGIAFAKSCKTIPITVDPSTPFSDGLPPTTGNIAFVAPVGSASSYRQGSSAKIEWTDSNQGDEHYWIHLVRDNSSGGLTYLYQIDGYLAQAGGSTSYTWRVPKSYSGSGFRIFINSGFKQRTYGVSPPFNIVP